MKKAFKILWSFLYPVLIYLSVSIIVELAFMLVFSINNSADISGVEEYSDALVRFINQNGLIITTIVNLILLPIYCLLLKFDRAKRIKNGAIIYKKPYIHQLVLVIVLGMTSAIGVNVLISISGIAALSNVYDEVSQILYSGGVALELLSAALAAPVVEELLFRGIIYKRLRDYLNPLASMLISAAVFGLFHGNLVQFVYAFIIGCMLAYTYEKLKTIAAPVLFHISANLIAVLITEFVSEKYMIVGIVLPFMLICLITMVVILVKMKNWNAEPEDNVIAEENI